MNKPIMTRRDAAAAGLGRYYTGVPCKHGHDTERYTYSGCCVDCTSAASTKSRQALKRILEAGKARKAA